MRHPGEILREDYLIPHNLQPFAVAQIYGIDFELLNDFLEERKPITPELATKLSGCYKDEEFWYQAQINYDRELLIAAKKQIINLFRNTLKTDKEVENLNKLIEKIESVTGE